MEGLTSANYKMGFVEMLQQSVYLHEQNTVTRIYNGHLTKSVYLIQFYHIDEMTVCRFIVIDCYQHL